MYVCMYVYACVCICVCVGGEGGGGGGASEGAIEITLYITEMRECLHECFTRVRRINASLAVLKVYWMAGKWSLARRGQASAHAL